MKCLPPYYLPYGNNEESGVYSGSGGSASLDSSETNTQTESYYSYKDLGNEIGSLNSIRDYLESSFEGSYEEFYN